MDSVWAYLRVSTRKEEQEDSLEEQLRLAQAYADKHGLLVKFFEEQASAKSITGRPVLTGLLSQLESAPVRQRPKCLYVTSLDRLARDIVDSMYIGRMLRTLKVALKVHGRGEVKLETFAERAMFVGESLGGDAENEAKSKRMRDSWDRRRREGKPTSNKHPYGLQLVGERDVAVSDSAAWVLNAFQWYDEGEGTHVIGKRFAQGAPAHVWSTSRVGEDGSPIVKTRTTNWEALRILKLLRQRRYRGTIVSAELFDRVNHRLENTPKRPARRFLEYPLSGAMKCSGCSRHLHGHASGGTSKKTMADGTKKRYLRERIRYYACVVCNYRLNAKVIEKAFFDRIGELSGSEELFRSWISAPRIGIGDSIALKKEAKALEAELTDSALEQRHNKLFDLAMSSSINDLEFRRQIDRLNLDTASKRSRLSEVTLLLTDGDLTVRTFARAKELLSSFTRLYTQSTYERKRQIVEAVAEALGGVLTTSKGLEWKRQIKID